MDIAESSAGPGAGAIGAFLTYKNRDYVLDIARRYLADKFQWAPPDTADTAEAFRGLVGDVLGTIAGMPDSPRLTLVDLNKRAITAIRYRVIAPETLATTASSGSVGTGAGSAEYGPPLPAIDRGVSAKQNGAGPDDEEEEGSFMEKLQELEQRRKVLWTPPMVPAAASASAAPGATQQAQSPSVAPIGTPVILAPPVPIARPAIPLFIHGWERDRVAYPGRAMFVWNGRLPSFMNPTSLKVTQVWLPMTVTTVDPTPYIRLEITGAGRQVADVILTGPGPGLGAWGVWAPCSDALARLPALAPPWTLRILTAEGHLLKMGADHHVVVSAMRYSGSIRIQCGRADAGASLGDVLHIYQTDGDLVRGRVTGHIGSDLLLDIGDEIAVGGEYALTGAVLVNVSRQVVVLLEGSRTSHLKDRGGGGGGAGES